MMQQIEATQPSTYYEILETIALTSPVPMENKHPEGSNRTWWSFLEGQRNSLREKLPSGPPKARQNVDFGKILFVVFTKPVICQF